jgi:lysophospholipase L1-like esterase
MGSLFPFRNQFVLTSGEQQYLNTTINAYNDAIRTVASTYNLAVVETAPFYQQLFSGFTYNGVTFSAQFVSGGAFSLDGIHLNAKGNALLANEFIRVINKHYGSVIPALNANAFSGVLFP